MLYQQTQELLQQLELQLFALDLWADLPPSADAFASSAPFACDTMAFEQWLQFILLPKMHSLINGQQPLPSNIAIAPMAQHLWAQHAERTPIIQILEQLDALLSR